MDLSWLWGGGNDTYEFSPRPKPVNRPFPTQEDVDFARQYGDFQHTGEFTPNTFEATNENIGDTNSTMGIRTLAEMGELPNPTNQALIDKLARNKLASRRSALVSLGMNDPNDNVVGATDFTFSDFAGKTIKQNNHPMFSFFGADDDMTSTPTHEAAHRGMMKLVDEIMNMPNSEETSRVRDYFTDPQTQEYAVRALMADRYGNPEKDRLPDLYKQFFENPNWQYELQDAREVNDLAEALAAKNIQQRTPSGPR